MFERPGQGEHCVLVHLELPPPYRQGSLAEFRELARAAGVISLGEVSGSRDAPDPRLFIGRGKLDELLALMQQTDADVALIDHALSPSQQRNLEAILKRRVLDRSGLILDIFARRARSFEGRLQVELAQLEHLSTRLVRGWTHLERQRGGIGLRGPGETQLETDRRLIAGRIRQIQKRLDRVRRQREQGRQARRKAELPTLALVGYTNAGKSTLFNQLSGAGVLVADQLFATLDPTLRRLVLESGQALILADTVGFISDLPHELVEAFMATLQEVREANLLLHVVDASDPDRSERYDAVRRVLEEIGAADLPQVVVYNKLDLVDDPGPLKHEALGDMTRVWLSARTGAGMDRLYQVLEEHCRRERVHGWLLLEPDQGRLRARLFELRSVSSEQSQADGRVLLELDMARTDWQRFQSQAGFPGLKLLDGADACLAGVG